MQIVLPGGLPDAAIAPELASHLEKKAPNLVGWLARAQATVVPALPVNTYCTPFEFWLLRQHGLEQQGGALPASSGLSVVYARESAIAHDTDQALWLAQLVHVAPARDGAALIPGAELNIASQESVALFDAAAESFKGSGFSFTPFDDHHWRVGLPDGFQPACASPALVSITSVNDWWNQDTAGRPWRRLVNELQMLWYTHPVNLNRESRGLRPINSLWLYGGADASAPAATAGLAPQIIRSLYGPALVQDWGSWLIELERLDQQVFCKAAAISQLVLTGTDRIVELSPAKRGLLQKWLGSQQDWRRWWSGHN